VIDCAECSVQRERKDPISASWKERAQERRGDAVKQRAINETLITSTGDVVTVQETAMMRNVKAERKESFVKHGR
jgi:hypothetical protein